MDVRRILSFGLYDARERGVKTKSEEVFREVRSDEEQSDELTTQSQAATTPRLRAKRRASSVTVAIILTHHPNLFGDLLRSSQIVGNFRGGED